MSCSVCSQNSRSPGSARCMFLESRCVFSTRRVFASGELGEGAVVEVGGAKLPWFDPEQARPKRGCAGSCTCRRTAGRVRPRAATRRPHAPIMLAERLTVGKADQRGAVTDLARQFSTAPIVLRLGKEGKPLAECGLIGFGVQPQEIRSAIPRQVGHRVAFRRGRQLPPSSLRAADKRKEASLARRTNKPRRHSPRHWQADGSSPSREIIAQQAGAQTLFSGNGMRGLGWHPVMWRAPATASPPP